MFSDQTILIINTTCITLMLVLMLVLIVGTRMKGGAGWAIIISVATTVPVYLSNTMRTLDSEHFLVSFYFATFLNLLCFPALWLFVRTQYDRSFRITWRSLIHLLPAVVSFIATWSFYRGMPAEQLIAEREYLEAGNENLPAIINDILLFGQFFAYFAAIFFYIRRRKKYILDHYADSGYFSLHWIPGFLTLFFVLFFIVFVAYVIDPRTDAWLIPILNTAALIYLVYNIIFHSMRKYTNRLPTIPKAVSETDDSTASPTMSPGQMKEICNKVMEYLAVSKAYTNPALSLTMLAQATGIHHKNISVAINRYLHKNFFDLINGMRVEKVKRRLLALNDNYTIESVAADCGFRSRSTFFAAFKKATGKTPTQWVKSET